MLTITVDIDAASLWLTFVGEQQIPFATSKMLRDVAKDVQQAERTHLRDIFTLRREQWADRSMKITHFPTKTELWADIEVSPPGATGPGRADILGKFEDDTEKTPRRGGRAIVIPLAAKRTGTGIISASARPKAFHFRPAAHQRGAYTVLVGDQHTVLIQRPDGSGVIVQHDGHHTMGARDGTLLYLLKPRVAIHPELHFHQIGERIVLSKAADRWSEAVDFALRTRR
jgi:hypothetical protein